MPLNFNEEQNHHIYDAMFNFLGDQPLQSDEIETLNLPPNTIRRLRYLLAQEARGDITTLQQFQLDAFKEVAFFLRLGNKHNSV